MRSWLVGFVMFGLAYAVLVVGMTIYTWPTARDVPTLEDELPRELEARVVEALAVSGPTPQSPYALDYIPVEGHDHPAIRFANGHTLMLEAGLPEREVEAVAQRYVELIDYHVTEARISQVERSLVVLLVPLLTFGLFAWLARWLWNRLARIQ